VFQGTILTVGVLLTGAAGFAEPLVAVPFTDVQIEDTFWAPRLKTTREKTLPATLKWCEDTGRISNFAKAGGLMEGDFQGIYFNDSDVYKVLEGASYLLHLRPDPELERYVDEIIAKIASAQQEDGYLNSYYTLVEPDRRWTDLRHRHELYCAGHMFEAAVAHYQATGKRNFLDVACKFADLIDSIFGPGKRHGLPGHEETELALVKLYQVTGEERYLNLAKFFVDERGNADGHNLFGDYCQDHIPIREQSEITGHAVRAMYLYSGVADVARLTNDQELIDMMERIWKDVVLRKMYITGGIGPSSRNEGFTVAYDLPNDTAYAETCASVGMALWNHRLNLLHADARFADVLEQVMYNGLLSGVALEGDLFFYVNPLASRGNHHRQPWFGCACCPSNVMRFLPSVGGYVYAHSEDAVYVNLYVTSTGTVPLKDTTVTVRQETNYPWDGHVAITVNVDKPARFTLMARIPGWSKMPRLSVKGRSGDMEPTSISKGYLAISREWQSGDVVELDFEMPVRRIRANPRVESNVGRVALQRGPIVYCLEKVDNETPVRSLALPPDAKVEVEHRPNLLGGVTVLKGTAVARQPEDWANTLYRPATEPKQTQFVAVPYYAWDNREPGDMVVWLPEHPSLAEAPPIPTLANTSKTSASHVQGSIQALSDQLEPNNSDDHEIPRFTWWDHLGTQEWVQYEFKEPARVSGVEVYWFDDEPRGGACRTPKSWELFYRAGYDWKRVEGASEYGTHKDRFNGVRFDPVETDGLRIIVQSRERVSAGILEWRITE